MNYYLLFSTILIFGILGGIVNAIRTNKDKNTFWKSLVKGIVASFLVPVFLEIIKSELGRNLTDNLYDFLIFGGLCLVAAIFSDKFIDTIGAKILEKAESAERKAEESNKKVDTVISKKAEPESPTESIDTRILSFEKFSESKSNQTVDKIIKSLKNEKYEYRTIDGLMKDTNLLKVTIVKMLKDLQEKEIVLSVRSGKRTLWTLNK